MGAGYAVWIGIGGDMPWVVALLRVRCFTALRLCSAGEWSKRICDLRDLIVGEDLVGGWCGCFCFAWWANGPLSGRHTHADSYGLQPAVLKGPAMPGLTWICVGSYH